ncbi:MAG: aminotransferase class IV [Thermodesulfobacteriota bacterium]|nr:aminotransferase class IV [Thermodesulfobacteriota bacterium]
MTIYYVDGKFVSSDKAVIPVDDLAVLRGFGVCDLMRTYNGRPCFLDEHINRLENSAREIGLFLPWSGSEIKKTALETLEKNSHIREANIRIVITGGSSPDFLTPQGNSRLLVLISPIPELPAIWYKKGIKVITISAQRNIPDAKSISYIPATMALKKARQENAVEALFVDKDNFVKEGTTSNLFAFIENRLVTPEKNVLKGITRNAILSISKDLFKTELRDIHVTELLKAEEFFITGTNKGIVPVVQVDDTIIGNGKPGRQTRKISAALDNYNRP